MAWWIWVLIAFALLALEMASTTLHVGLFAIGALTVALLDVLGVELSLTAELFIFTIVSLAALLVVRPILVRKLRLNVSKPVDSLIGEVATVTDDVIGIAGIGKAEMRGSTWSARNVGASAVSRGERVVVERVEGLVLHIRAANS
jgi:membrane protein implicated in regulation of membrane protease activity